jgi:hypothetical protein
MDIRRYHDSGVMGPYRDGGVAGELACPRCKKQLPPFDVAYCTAGCGVWVSAFAATEVLSESERRIDRLTRWWRIREPCPICKEQMLLRGVRDAHFQGCDGHGFWLDIDAVPRTGLAAGVDEARLDRKRYDEARLRQDLDVREQAERDRAQGRRDQHVREARLARALKAFE